MSVDLRSNSVVYALSVALKPCGRQGGKAALIVGTCSPTGALPRLPLEKQGFSVIKGGKREWRVHRDSGEPQHGDRITLLEAKEFRMFPAQVGTLMVSQR